MKTDPAKRVADLVEKYHAYRQSALSRPMWCDFTIAGLLFPEIRKLKPRSAEWNSALSRGDFAAGFLFGMKSAGATREQLVSAAKSFSD